MMPRIQYSALSGIKLPAVVTAVRGFIILLLGLLMPGSLIAAEPKTLRFGVLPVMSPVTLLKRFAPISYYLQLKTGHPVEFESARDFDTFVRRTAAQRYDVVFTAPHFVPAALDSGRYVLLAAPGNRLLVSLIVPTSSPYHSLSSLKGKVIAMPPEQAFVAVIGRGMFDAAGAGTASGTEFISSRSHNAAFESVLGGDADAAMVSQVIVRRELQAENWRVVQTSKDYPAAAFLVATDLDPSLRQRLSAALIGMHDDDQGGVLIHGSLFKSFVAADPEDYQPMTNYLSPGPAPSGKGKSGHENP